MLDFLLASLPLLIVLYLLLGRNWSSSGAGTAGWAVSTIIAISIFGANSTMVMVSLGKTVFLALYVLYIVWMALLLYHIVSAAGAIDTIGRELPKLVNSTAEQTLLLPYVFGSFLQGAAGFGVPAAVIAPLLVGLGFKPTTAVVVALIGHGWAVTYGSLGSSFGALLVATGLDYSDVASESAILLAIAGLLCGGCCLWIVGRASALKQQGVRLVVVTILMGSVQWALAVTGSWHVAAFGGGLAGLLLLLVDFGRRPQARKIPFKTLLKAFAPYLILIGVIIVGQFILRDWLGSIKLTYPFPRVETTHGWVTEAANGRPLNLFGHQGALLLYTSLLSYVYFRLRGTLSDKPFDWQTIVWQTVQRSRKATISMLTLLAMAVTMEHAGMTHILASAFSKTGFLFPFLSPLIGALGAFMTGSNTSSNLVFGGLQMASAAILSLPIPIILAGQTAGGAIGSIFAPAKVVVGVSTVPNADESQLFRTMFIYGGIIIFLLGLILGFTILFFSVIIPVEMQNLVSLHRGVAQFG